MPVSRPTITPRYQAAIDYLYSFINYENKMPPSPDHARFNLDRMYQLLAALDHPEARYAKVVIAGTKGKGSTAAMIEAMLRAAGYRTGLYSSPHLHSWRERVQVNRTLIEQDAMAALIERLQPIVEQLEPTWGMPTTFELATALALAHFADASVDVAVLEIGLGGRYDSVNVVVPDLSIITPISFDHMAVLGSTLGEIAYNKAGIIKPGVPVIIAPQDDEALAVIVQEATTHAPLWQATAEGVRQFDKPAQPVLILSSSRHSRSDWARWPSPDRERSCGGGGGDVARHQGNNDRAEWRWLKDWRRYAGPPALKSWAMAPAS